MNFEAGDIELDRLDKVIKKYEIPSDRSDFIQEEEIELSRLDTVIQRLEYVPSHRSDCIFCNEKIRINPTQEGPFDQNSEIDFKVWQKVQKRERWGVKGAIILVFVAILVIFGYLIFIHVNLVS